jgi:peptide/nickel transport system substrate-binding protein
MEQPAKQQAKQQAPQQVPEKKSSFLRKIISYLFYILFVLVFVWVAGQLFFQKEMNLAVRSVVDLFGGNGETENGIQNLRVIYPDEPVSLEPTLTDPSTRTRLVNIYEPLVQFDAFYNIRPALALSWGLIDDFTWEFDLRPGVVFHDGTEFDVEDVVASVERAKSHKTSELFEIADTIDEIEVLDDMTFRIKTVNPDPLLLQKLALMMIVPSEDEDGEIETPIGTGSYKFQSWEGGTMLYERFDAYWGNRPKFDTVELNTIADKSDRVNAFLRGDADLLAFVSYDAVSTVEERGFEIASIPTLEVQVLLFNVNSDYLNTVQSRKAVSLAVDQDGLVEKLGGYARAINQFVSNGIFGFDPNISNHEFDREKAEKLAEELELTGKTLQFHLLKGLDVLGEQIREDLKEVGIYLIVSYLEVWDFIESLEEGSADIYFMGFKSELGDASEFLNSTVYSKGEFNDFDYENPNVDYLIESAMVELDPARRRDNLQEAMRIVVEEDVIGIPLFEYETVFAFVEGLEFLPRIDGLIYFDEIIIK